MAGAAHRLNIPRPPYIPSHIPVQHRPPGLMGPGSVRVANEGVDKTFVLQGELEKEYVELGNEVGGWHGRVCIVSCSTSQRNWDWGLLWNKLSMEWALQKIRLSIRKLHRGAADAAGVPSNGLGTCCLCGIPFTFSLS